MTHDKYEELHFLKILLDVRESKKQWYTFDEVMLKVRTGRMNPQRALALYDILKNGEYINVQEHPNTKEAVYNISDAGKWYLSHLLIEEQKDALDLKLKDISIKNIKITRVIAWASLIISIAVGGVQIYRLIDEKQNPKYSIKESQVEQLLQSQQALITNFQTLQQGIFHSDTLVKRIKIVKK